MQQGQLTTGTVTAANERGFQLHGQAAWFNWSKFAEEPRYYPTPGQQIVVSLFDDGWVRKVAPVKPTTPITVETAPPETMQRVAPSKQDIAHPANSHATVGIPARNPQLDRDFRLKCLTLAVETLRSYGTDMQDVGIALKRAEKIARWAEGREE